MDSLTPQQHKGGRYPIDHSSAEGSIFISASEDCMAELGSESQQVNIGFQPSNASKVEVKQDNVIKLQVFEDQLSCFLLALHSPEDEAQVVAVHLHGRWWTVDDVLKTSSADRSGLVTVQSDMERVIMFLLSQQIGDKLPGEETLFSAHPRTEVGKILWLNGEAVGFYTIKKKGSLCDGCTSQSYVLPVLDTVLVRRHVRRRGLGLQMLTDFCASFPNEEVLGISRPMSPSMTAVCRKYLELDPSQRERLYEVEPPGGWGQRRNIWLNLQLQRADQQRSGEEGAVETDEVGRGERRGEPGERRGGGERGERESRSRKRRRKPSE